MRGEGEDGERRGGGDVERGGGRRVRGREGKI